MIDFFINYEALQKTLHMLTQQNAAILGLLVEKNIVTLEEYERMIVLSGAVLDQRIAEQRDKKPE